LKGEMSLVGPRPEVRHYTDQFTEEEQAILSVRPGITDWASIWNADEGALLAGAEDPEHVYATRIRPTKLRLQLKYVREQSFFTDLKIIFLTALAVARPGSRAIEDLRRELPAAAGDTREGADR
jgi:lipopolysaccharide/colanic/teichoic acid biosynthesis glycosyltransferase